MTKLVGSVLLLLAATSCGHQSKGDPRYPPQSPGCKVQFFRTKVPDTIAYDHIGRVDVICGDRIPEGDCLRTLMDEACKLGGDILYDLSDPEKPAPDKVKFLARAAHTHIAKAPAPAASP